MAISDYRDWLGLSVLSQSADAYVGYLQHHQYCPGSVRAYLHSIAHFAFWLTRQRTPLPSVGESMTQRFVTEHLPVCHCPAPCQRSVNAVRPALGHLLHVLRVEGHISGPQALIPPAIQDELERFDAHLDTVCGLAPATRTSRRQWLGRFWRIVSAPLQ